LLTQQTIAEHLDLSQPAVSDLVQRLGIDWRESTLDDMRFAYIRHLREKAAGREADGSIDLATERARLAKAQRERVEMQNALTRRELAPVILIEQVLAKAGSRVAGVLDAIPVMIKRRTPSLSAAVLNLIVVEIARARNIAAAISLADLQDETPPRDLSPDEGQKAGEHTGVAGFDDDPVEYESGS